MDCSEVGVLYPLGVERVRFVVPFATAWNVVLAELLLMDIGLVTVPIPVFEDVIGTWTVTLGLSCCCAKTSSVPGTSTAGAMVTEVSLPTEAVKLLFVRTKPDGLTFTVTVASG